MSRPATALLAASFLCATGVEAQAPALRLADEPRLRVGVVDGPDEQMLFRVEGALLRSDGSIVVANHGTMEIRAYDPSGSMLWSTGGSGQGPGEFRTIRGLRRLAGDTVVVWDSGQRRATVIGPAGRVARVVTGFEPATVEVEGRKTPVGPNDMVVLEDGTMVFEPGFVTQYMTRGPDGVRRDTVPLLVYGPDGRSLGVIGPVPAAETWVQGGSSMVLPFGHRLHLAARGSEIYVGSGRDPIAVYDARGRRLRVFEPPIDPEALEAEHFADARERYLGRLSPGLRAEVGDWFDAMPRPGTLPLYARLLHGADGRLWIQRGRAADDPLQRWIALGRDGEIDASLSLPSGFEVMDVGLDFVLVRVFDELDTEQLRVYDLRR